ncbi:TetR family transcriptional regulator [Streptomyces mashuensis]|uniref:TetR family transcriptional regulator n=2 Tax=Streptomyces mashuensis TaxID=33904 RepID=A0A919AYM7_9ACTN|nr:TetR family transcriptional regulator [Streptomyces mashuensis]
MAERREQLVATALELFSHRPPDSVSLDDIATAAGVSRPLVYHYFPCKRDLYEAALRRAADELTALLTEPCEGPLGTRVLHVMGRFFDFVETYGAGFAALLRGGPAAPGPGAPATLIDGVRQAAYEQLLRHLAVAAPLAPRTELTFRSWISLAEVTALLWLDGRRVPRAELEVRLAQDLLALAAVAAAFDEAMAVVLRRMLADEPADGPFAELVGRLTALAAPAPPSPVQPS